MRQLQATVEEERALGPKWRQAQAEGAPGIAAYRVLYDGHCPSAGAIILIRQAAAAAADRREMREEVPRPTLTLTLTLPLALALTRCGGGRTHRGVCDRVRTRLRRRQAQPVVQNPLC